MAFSYGPYTFDAQADGDAAAFSWTDQTGTTTALQNANSAGRWCFDTNATTSSNVGPDHGQGGSPDGYAYTEMSSQTSGDIWIVEFGTALDASTNNIEVDYYWCMRGDAVRATIQLQTNENGAGWVNRGSQTGYGDETIPGTSGATTWWNKTVDLTGLVSNASTRVRWYIVATADPTSSMWHNDIGIDTITITGTTSTVIPAITNCGDEDHYIGETGVTITGTGFQTDGASSRVRIDSSAAGTGTSQTQTDTSWSDTSINFTVSLGSLSYGTNYLFVRNHTDTEENATGYSINLYQNLTTSGLNDTTIYHGQTGIELSGTGFNATQGTSKVYLCDSSDGSGTNIEQTVTTWTATKVTFTAVRSTLSLGTVYVILGRNQSSLGDSSERLSPSQSATLGAVPSLPTIDSIVAGTVAESQEDVLISGDLFEATQGTGKVEVCPTSSYASAVAQTVVSWSNDEIVIDMVRGGLSLGTLYLFVTNDSSDRSTGFAFTMVADPITDVLFVESSFQTTITSAGLQTTAFMVRDE